MGFTKLALALISVFGISAGQLLLKLGAVHLQNSQTWAIEVAGLRVSAYLIAGIGVLGASTLVWVSVLRTVPLSFAYPIMALAFVVVPAMSYFVLGEPLSIRLAIGSLIIATGLVVIYT